MRRQITTLFFCLLASHASAAPFWDYDGKTTGQDSWADITPDYGLCATGSNQSPVAIGTTRQKDLPALQFNYQPGAVMLSLDRYSVVATPVQHIGFSENDDDASLTEMLIRSPSEHEVLGTFYPIELQLFHRRRDDRRVIVSVFVQMGKENKAFQPLIDHYPSKIGETQNITLDWDKLLPTSRGYYAYRGSLSYPPCTEGVEWRVLKTPVDISEAQAHALARHLGRNSRAVQPMMLRTIFESRE